MMVVGVCRFVLALPGNRSLKDKRKHLKPLVNALHQRHMAAVAEVGMHNVLDRAEIGLALVGNDRRVINSRIDKLLEGLEALVEARVLESDFEITNY